MTPAPLQPKHFPSSMCLYRRILPLPPHREHATWTSSCSVLDAGFNCLGPCVEKLEVDLRGLPY